MAGEIDHRAAKAPVSEEYTSKESDYIKGKLIAAEEGGSRFGGQLSARFYEEAQKEFCSQSSEQRTALLNYWRNRSAALVKNGDGSKADIYFSKISYLSTDCE